LRISTVYKAYAENIRDLLVALTLCDQLQHLALLGRTVRTISYSCVLGTSASQIRIQVAKTPGRFDFLRNLNREPV
jgi:hypothetical protein